MKIWCCTYLPRHFCAWSLSMDTIQILHAIWIRHKVQMLVLNEKVCTPKPPWLVCRDQVYSAVICHPRGSLQTAHRCCLYPLCLSKWFYSLKKVVCSPSPASRNHGIVIHSCGRPGMGHPPDFSTTLNLPLNPTIGDGLKCTEPQCVYEPMYYLFIFRLPTAFMSIWD